jgi:hypothetical protein
MAGSQGTSLTRLLPSIPANGAWIPWVVWRQSGGGGTQRGEFEIHGGSGTHEFQVSRTNGCIRLKQAGITSLKSKWNNYTNNRQDPYAELTDYYY